MTARQRLGTALNRVLRVMEHGTVTSVIAAVRRWELLDASARRSRGVAMKPSDFMLGDDGTLDTVLECRHCNAELRYMFEPDMGSYDDFVDWAKEDAAEQHECGEA